MHLGIKVGPDNWREKLLTGLSVRHVEVYHNFNLVQAHDDAPLYAWLRANGVQGRLHASSSLPGGVFATLGTPDVEGDIDYLIVAAPHRVWLTRLFSLFLVHRGRLEDLTICPNYVISSDMLAQFSPSLFSAHELAQMVPIYFRICHRHVNALLIRRRVSCRTPAMPVIRASAHSVCAVRWPMPELSARTATVIWNRSATTSRRISRTMLATWT